jgi:hypothetical protein
VSLRPGNNWLFKPPIIFFKSEIFEAELRKCARQQAGIKNPRNSTGTLQVIGAHKLRFLAKLLQILKSELKL